MTKFPRTKVDRLSVSRMIIGTNWFLGCSHTSRAKDLLIYRRTPKQVADVIAVYLRAGIDAMIGVLSSRLHQAIKIAQDKVGRKVMLITIPVFELPGTPDAESKNARLLDTEAKAGTQICMPHQSTTDALLDQTSGHIRHMHRITAMIRARGMVPGLSTHMPEVPICADKTGLDVATYIQIYNALGFLMQYEIEGVHHIIHNSRKPVITIKPMAAGRLTPFVGLNFVWATIREQDMVAVGTMTADEAREVIDLSLSILERQKSRRKKSATRK